MTGARAARAGESYMPVVGGNLFLRRLDGPCRIANPLAPGAGVELRAGKTGDFERKEIVARRYTRTTHRDGLRRRLATQRFEPFGPKGLRWQEASLRIEVVRKRMIARTRHMPGDRIDGFVLARESVCRAGVDECSLAAAEPPGGQ